MTEPLDEARLHAFVGKMLGDLGGALFAEIFWATKDIETVRRPCPYPPSIEVVYPVL